MATAIQLLITFSELPTRLGHVSLIGDHGTLVCCECRILGRDATLANYYQIPPPKLVPVAIQQYHLEALYPYMHVSLCCCPFRATVTTAFFISLAFRRIFISPRLAYIPNQRDLHNDRRPSSEFKWSMRGSIISPTATRLPKVMSQMTRSGRGPI